VEVAVRDTGPGIAAADLETIFEEFEQTADGKQAEGTGLGLPLSRRLVELHGGRLWAESTPGRGSTFRFTLPAHQEVS
jgi:signal transduction histidine kinase